MTTKTPGTVINNIITNAVTNAITTGNVNVPGVVSSITSATGTSNIVADVSNLINDPSASNVGNVVNAVKVWLPEHEEYLRTLLSRSQQLSALYDDFSKWNQRISTFLKTPSVGITAITGAGALATTNMASAGPYKNLITVVIGAASMAVAACSALEAHKGFGPIATMAAKAKTDLDKLIDDIKLVLAQTPANRQLDGIVFVRDMYNMYVHIVEGAPSLPKNSSNHTAEIMQVLSMLSIGAANIAKVVLSSKEPKGQNTQQVATSVPAPALSLAPTKPTSYAMETPQSVSQPSVEKSKESVSQLMSRYINVLMSDPSRKYKLPK